MTDDAGPPSRRRLGRHRPIEPAQDAATLDDGPDAIEPAAAEADADGSDAVAAMAADAAGGGSDAEAVGSAPDPAAGDPDADAGAAGDAAESPLRRRLGRRAALLATSNAGSTPLADAGHDRLAEPTEVAPAWLPLLEDRSPNAAICPFLRAVDDRGVTLPPIEAPDPANRCAALREPVPQSLRQQELVCLTAGHVNCPRYLRGAVAATDGAAPAVRMGRAATPAVLGSIVVLALAFTASIAFVLARGGLDLTAAVTPAPSASAAAVVPTPAPTQEPTIAPVATPTPAPTPTPSPTPAPTPTPTPTPAPTPTPEPTPSPAPTSDRYALLKPCPDTPDCWIYTVRRGDNLFSIANYFGVSLESIYDRNPWTRTQGLRAGRELRLPPPTR